MLDGFNIAQDIGLHGNIEPAEYDASSSKEYKKLLQLISRNEDKLFATMTDEQKELFTGYADCVREYQANPSIFMMYCIGVVVKCSWYSSGIPWH